MSKLTNTPNRSRYIFTRCDMMAVLAVHSMVLNRMIQQGQIPPPANFTDSESQHLKGHLQRWSRQDILAWMWCGMPRAAEWADLKARYRTDTLAAGIAPRWDPEGKDLEDSDLPADEVALDDYLDRLSDAVVDKALTKLERGLLDRGILEEEPRPPDKGDEEVSLMPKMIIPLADPVTGAIKC